MNEQRSKTLVALPLLSVLAVFALHIVGLRNGMLQQIANNVESPLPTIPGTDVPLRTSWTDQRLVDRYLSTMNSVFEVVLDERNVSLFVQANHFFGLWMSIWISILVESHRPWSGGISKLYTFWGLLMEFAGVAVGAPAWFAVHLAHALPFISAQHHTKLLQASSILVEDLQLVPWSYLIGLGLPTLGMVITRRDANDIFLSNQLWILIRLVHPAIISCVHRLLRSLSIQKLNANGNINESQYRFTKIRMFYTTAFWLAAGPHVLILSTIISLYIFPSLLPASVANSISVGSLWPVASIWRSFHDGTESIQTGVATFMTANEVISSIAFLLWAWTLNRKTLQKVPGARHLHLDLVRIVLTALILGPGAAAITLLQNQEDILEQTSKNEKIK